MKKMIALFSIISVLLLSACEEKTTVTVLTSSGYEPYEMIDTNGNLTGFDIELMEALAEEAGIKIEWKDVAFEGIIASLQSGQASIAIAGISPTPERAEMVDFSDIYYNSALGLTNVIISDQASNITSLEDLEGKIVSAQLGTVQATFLESVKDEYNFTVDLRDNNTQIVEEIKAGRIDALIVEVLISESILEQNSSLISVGFESALDDAQGNAIAFSKGSPYVEIFNEALQTLIENGTVEALIEKWFNQD
jgi:polar amino acid transport system substrate-binding protein